MADHGEITGDTVRGRYDESAAVLDRLAALDIEYADVVELLEREGVDKFEKSWSELLRTVEDELARASVADSPEEAGR